ncbi:MAG: hypothetical protein IJQ83_02280 [Bacteroidales bacterium]|nr:hypothetical protein [Bacteroidales bacterium]
MKKTIVALAIVLMTITSFAQENNEKPFRVPSGYKGFLETGLGGVWNQYSVDGYLYSISTTHGYQFNDKVFAGLGVGYGVGIFSSSKLIPFYGSFRYVFLPTKKASPVVRARAGAYYSMKNFGPYGDMGVGVRFATKSRIAFNLMATYSYYHNVTVTHYHSNFMTMYPSYYEDRQDNISNVSLVFSLEW